MLLLANARCLKKEENKNNKFVLSGGFFFSKMIVDKFLKKYIVYYHPGLCMQTVIFLLGTILGPIVFVPAGLVLLVKAAIDPVDKENCVSPKQKKFAKW